MEQVQDLEVQRDKEPGQKITTATTGLETPTTTSKKVDNKKNNYGIPTDKQKTSEEFEKSNDAL